ncbi:EpsG family protein [Dolichospermum planctonicum]|uniref:Transmembrane protein EpsG n=1 Tax=Dolichospermum planctonicum TaxID=136072 RepID=A0A480AIB7_9CYAN|nr:EpsG family protein [Dolichospermum planctonicum]GCL41814.1 hypothetical protein NIES80_15110 [Dolichospermum planctonicum]
MIFVESINHKVPGMALHQVFAKLYQAKYLILATSLILWSIIPIIGTFFLLLYCQINISGNKIIDRKILFLQNLIPLILVLFTIIIYNASITPFGDTDVYIRVYKLLYYEPLFHTVDAFDTDKEPVAFILSQFVSKLTSGDEFSFLLFQSATINTAITIYSVIFVPELYPMIILINIMSNGYYYQLFWMPQFYSFIFIIPSLYISNYIKSVSLICIAYFTHNSSLSIIGVFIYEKITHYLIHFFKVFKLPDILNNKKNISLIYIFIVLPLSSVIFQNFVEFALSQDIFTSKINSYSGAQSANFNQDHFNIRNQLRSILDYSVISIFLLKSEFNKFNSLIFFRWVGIFFIMLFFYAAVYTFGFNMRASALFFCLPGFFYIIPIYSGKLDGSINIYSFILVVWIIVRSIYFAIALLNENNYLTFFENQELSTTITGYFQLLFSQ